MSSSAETALDRAVVTLLRALVRLLLKRGVAYGQFAELAKRAYVETAREDFGVPGRKPSISRVAVLTGLTRKEATRILRVDDEITEGSARRRVNRAARVVSAWAGEREFQDSGGQPANLPLESSRAPSFWSLVAKHGGDVPPRAVLDELFRVGVVCELKNGKLKLMHRAYIPSADAVAKVDFLGTDVADLIASIENNLDPDSDARFFQRNVTYDNLPKSYLPKLRKLLSKNGQGLLELLDADMARHDGDVQGQEELADPHRALVGIYYYEDVCDQD
ncbi:MAG: hypothetical protein GY910_05740 [bacterium]|nr:hypothetical protein [bacterium]